MKVSEVMTKNPETLKETDTIQAAAKLMLEKGYSVIPVLDDKDQLVGVFTESDFVGKEIDIPHALASIKQLFNENYYQGDMEQVYKDSKDKPLSVAMTKNPKTVSSNETLNYVLNFMTKENIKRVPIVDEGKLVGIVTRKDLIKAFVNIS